MLKQKGRQRPNLNNLAPKKRALYNGMQTDEKFVASIHCRKCGDCLRQSKPIPLKQFLKDWGETFATAPVVGAKVQQSINCECFDGETGKGSAVGIKVWACESMQYVDIVMKDLENRNFTITEVKPR